MYLPWENTTFETTLLFVGYGVESKSLQRTPEAKIVLASSVSSIYSYNLSILTIWLSLSEIVSDLIDLSQVSLFLDPGGLCNAIASTCTGLDSTPSMLLIFFCASLF